MYSKILENILLENGLIVGEDEKNESLQMDSLTFASLILSIEEKFNLTVPIDMLLYKEWETVNIIESEIIKLLSQKT
jgi:acyl carrier protein